MADSKKMGMKWFILPCRHEIALAVTTEEEKKKHLCSPGLGLWLTRRKERYIAGMDGREGGLSALHWQHKRTHYSESKGMFVVKTALDERKREKTTCRDHVKTESRPNSPPSDKWYAFPHVKLKQDLWRMNKDGDQSSEFCSNSKKSMLKDRYMA